MIISLFTIHNITSVCNVVHDIIFKMFLNFHFQNINLDCPDSEQYQIEKKILTKNNFKYTLKGEVKSHCEEWGKEKLSSTFKKVPVSSNDKVVIPIQLLYL